MKDFLAHILPVEGWRCATLFVGKKVSNHFFSSNAELASFIDQHDACGNTVYHACATYKEPTRRLKTNVRSVKSLWLDIDGGPDAVAKRTGYETAVAGVGALGRFCRDADLPAPTVVSSGSGLHVYWTFGEAVDPAQWDRYARGLKRRCAKLGLQCDPARTADSASILRTPGSHNRKRSGSVEVQSCAVNGPYSLERFGGLLDAQSRQTLSQQSNSVLAQQSAAHLAYRATNLASVSIDDLGSGPPRYSEAIADKCQQIAELRRTRGLLSEPVWYAGLAVLAFADDGDRYAHEWSTGDQRYNPEETNRKLAQARRLSGATTCRRFEEVNPAGCKGCPYQGCITSPISLGYTDTTGERSGLPEQHAITSTVNGHYVLPILPKGFEWEKESIVFASGINGGGVKKILISQQPLYINAVNKSEVKEDFSLTFRHKIPSEGWKTMTVGSKDLFGPNGIGELTKHGVNIHEHDLFRKYVHCMIDMRYEKEPVQARFDQYGFKPQGFLYGRYLYTPAGPQEAAVNEELAIRNRWIGPGVGSHHDPATGLERWKQAANSLFAAGCESQSIAVLASFAAPLMRYLAVDEGGAILSLVNRESGKGKTTALAGAASVWGLREGLGLTNEDNRVTKYLTLAALGNLPLVYDEIETKDPTVIRSFVVNFTNGRDKMRADRTGQIRHSAATWQTIMICASNSSIVDVLSTGSEADAPAYRLFEMETTIPANLKNVMGEKLRGELIANAGYAGEVYASYLVQVRDQLPGWIEQSLRSVREKTGLPDRYRFWTRLIAVIAVAGTIVRHLDLLDISVDRLISWLLERVKDHKQQEGVETTPDESPEYAKPLPLTDKWAFREMARFVGETTDATLVVSGIYQKGHPLRPINQPRNRIIARYETGSKRFTVTYEALKEYAVSRGFPWYLWRDELEKAGVMSGRKRITLTAGTEIPGAQVYCFEVNLNHHVMSGEEETSITHLRVVDTGR